MDKHIIYTIHTKDQEGRSILCERKNSDTALTDMQTQFKRRGRNKIGAPWETVIPQKPTLDLKYLPSFSVSLKGDTVYIVFEGNLKNRAFKIALLLLLLLILDLHDDSFPSCAFFYFLPFQQNIFKVA